MGYHFDIHIRFQHWAAFLPDLLRHRHTRMVIDDTNNIIRAVSYVLRQHEFGRSIGGIEANRE